MQPVRIDQNLAGVDLHMVPGAKRDAVLREVRTALAAVMDMVGLDPSLTATESASDARRAVTLKHGGSPFASRKNPGRSERS